MANGVNLVQAKVLVGIPDHQVGEGTFKASAEAFAAQIWRCSTPKDHTCTQSLRCLMHQQLVSYNVRTLRQFLCFILFLHILQMGGGPIAYGLP